MRRLVVLHQNEENNEHLSVISSLEFRKFLRQRIKVSGFKETQAVNEDALYLALQKVEAEMFAGNDVVFRVAEDDDHQFEIKELVKKYHYVLVDSALV